jgi:hypothetical protein
MILSCKCKHEYQDKKYGIGRRVYNTIPPKKGISVETYRCTVCGNVRGN